MRPFFNLATIFIGQQVPELSSFRIGWTLEQLVHDNPTLSPTNAWAKDSETEPPSVSLEVLDEYFFLRGILSDAQPTASVPAVRKQNQVTAMWQKYLGRYYAVMTTRLRMSRR
jgi:hypothetical protein